MRASDVPPVMDSISHPRTELKIESTGRFIKANKIYVMILNSIFSTIFPFKKQTENIKTTEIESKIKTDSSS